MEKTFDVLEIHSAIATYQGTEFKISIYANASSNLAKFRIEKYLEFKVKKQMGGGKLQSLEIDLTKGKQKEEILDFIKTLNKGDKIKLNWEYCMVEEKIDNSTRAYSDNIIKSINKV